MNYLRKRTIFAEQYPVRDEILVEIEYPREHGRAVRYAICSDILSLTGQQVMAGFILSTDILLLTEQKKKCETWGLATICPFRDIMSVEKRIKPFISVPSGLATICPYRDIISVENRIKPFISVPSGLATICPFRDIMSVEKRIKPFISVP